MDSAGNRRTPFKTEPLYGRFTKDDQYDTQRIAGARLDKTSAEPLDESKWQDVN
jgi:hypothetical protein